ncbi:hypothetical protein PsorP6_003393 [Peronosclerospora sorghi]|uniref:Uncharacterized protein n=1 Tax=Peronosclerospora sorghi TaxID=230839 RepID=A0ACC0VPM0_9STRA|nr:hypothetical protein PsorP6_003393 [Peronosclerospora sorghi]
MSAQIQQITLVVSSLATMARGGSSFALGAANTPQDLTLPSQCSRCTVVSASHAITGAAEIREREILVLRASYRKLQGMREMGGTAVHWWRQMDGAGEEGRVATLLSMEGIGDGEDGTVLVEDEDAGGEGGAAVSLEALVNEEPYSHWPDYSLMTDLFEHPFGNYHAGFSAATLDEIIPIERNDCLGLLPRRVDDEQRGCEDLIFLAPGGGYFYVYRRTL